MKCEDCGTNFRGKVCPCGWKAGGNTPKAQRSACMSCGEVHNREYLVNSGSREICNDCLLIEQLSPEDRAYFKQMSDEYKFPVQDMPAHLMAANNINMPLPAYLITLPRNRAEFAEYWKDREIKIGNITL